MPWELPDLRWLGRPWQDITSSDPTATQAPPRELRWDHTNKTLHTWCTYKASEAYDTKLNMPCGSFIPYPAAGAVVAAATAAVPGCPTGPRASTALAAGR